MAIRALNKFILILTSAYGVCSCGPDKTVELLGVLPVNGNSEYSFELTQELDYTVHSGISILCRVMYRKDSALTAVTHVAGVSDRMVGMDNFSANQVDSVIYLTFMDENVVYAAYDLRTGKGYPYSDGESFASASARMDSIMMRLKAEIPALRTP